MKKKNFIRELRKFAKGESKEVLDFITRFENAKSIINRDKKKKKTNRYKIPTKFTKETYQQYLETDLWRNIRKRVFDLRGKYCEGCGTDANIQVHHSVYSQRVFSGQTLNGLRVVCRGCHEKIHKVKDEQRISLRQATKYILDNQPARNLSKELEDVKKMKKNLS